VESKFFQLEVEKGSTGLWIHEKCRGVAHSIFLGRRDSFWLLDMVEEVLLSSNTEDFWRRSRSGSPSFFVQRCANKHGRFLIVEDFGGGRRRGCILIPEGRRGEGWNSFILELRAVVTFMKSYVGVGNSSKPAQAFPVVESKPSEKVPEPSRRRSFAEVMMQKCPETLYLSRKAMKISKGPERLTEQLKNPENPFVLMKRTSSEMPKIPERPPVQLRNAPVQPLNFPAKQFIPKQRSAPKPKVPEKFPPKSQGSRIPVSLSELGNGADRVDSLGLGRDGSDIAFEEDSHLFGDYSERVSFKNTLNRILVDVEKCLKWLDSGLCPCASGLLGPAPKPFVKAHMRQSLPADPVRGSSSKEKKKGLLGLKPKVVFKPVLDKRGSKRSGPGPIDKGKKGLNF
jgi:hypothetical protein